MNKRGVFNNLNKTLFLGGFCSLMASFLLGLGSNSVFANSFSITTGNDPVLELKLSSNSVNLDLTPKPDVPVFNTTNLTVTAGTNNLTGYTLYMNVDNPNLTRTESITNNPNTPTIPSLTTERTEGYTEDNFTRNHWGYHLSGETNYFAIPTEQLQLSTSPEPVNENTTTITFASKVDMTLPAGSYTTNMTFYAVTNAPVPTMQDIDNWKDSLIADHSIKARDTRDGKYYNVTKLSSDNRIWMTQNLNLSGGTTITSADSNVTTDYTLPASSTEGFNEDSVAYVYNDKTYGGYYSYAAATTGTNLGTNDGTNTNATSDICPKGWRLPTEGEYTTLKSTYTTGATLTAAPWNGEYGGNYYNSTAYDIGSMGNYWTSTASYTNMAYIVSIEDAVVSIYDDSNYYGSSIRCLVKNPDTIITYNANGGTGTMPSQNLGENGSGTISTNTFTRVDYKFTGWNTEADGSGTPYAEGANYTGTSTTLYAQWLALPPSGSFTRAYYDASKPTTTISGTDYYRMQDMTSSICGAVSNGQAGSLVDTRDNKVYTVAKIGSLCWMTKNVNIAGGTTLTSATSNVSSNYKLPSSSTSGWSSDSGAYVYNDSEYGGYYSWKAVTAGTGALTTMTATYDVCPKGWRLPSSSNWSNLNNNIGSNATLAPFYGQLGGFTTNTGVAIGSKRQYPNSAEGTYWGNSVWYDSDYSEYQFDEIGFSTTSFYVSSSDTFSYGRTARCVAK